MKKALSIYSSGTVFILEVYTQSGVLIKLKLLWSEVVHSQPLRRRERLGGLNIEEEGDLCNR